ncbi:hypothetical protein JGU71_09355 [Antrihabitans sp. YC3-6]|uniref:Uncharacterized protein n=1 Tax=Antrihabitans stalagmiti TaxID=2799499 RepID=A0A934U2R8_9NOCA|nr:hypothetical protein [Antrihabitans stalagmiti]MBJ8339091.1 hypothetical protein [Antrihabitans stalagmiti]
MPVKDVCALLLGLGIAIVATLLARQVRDEADASMRWEGGVAVGFAALLYIGPFWIAQLVLTVLATIDDSGIASGWLWAWLFAAPAIGISPPATGLVRLLRRGRPGVD